MRINHNLASLNTYRQLSSNTANGSKSLEKLSSGLRINRAGDDAAGLAISEKMRGQIRGLDQAQRNAQDGISLIQTAEGALNETHSILQRMRELAVQSSNDTNVSIDRSAIQNEINQLTSEIDRIGNTTEFNTKTLLNGGASVTAKEEGTTANTAAITVLGGTGDTKVGASIVVASFAIATAAATDTGTTTFSVAGGLTAKLSADSTATINGVSFSFGTSNTVQSAIDTINNANIGVTASYNSTSGAIDFKATTVGADSKITATGLGGSFANVDASSTGTDADIYTPAGYSYTAEGNTITIQSGDAKGLQLQFSGTTATFSAGTATYTVTANGGLNMHIGANENQSMYVSIGDMRATALGVNALDLTSANSAESAITTINDAITKVSTERAKLGAYQNRLEHTINNLGTSSENLTASESRVRDVDMAKEMMDFTKNNILSQAATAMLAQANQQPQGVLQLLR